MKVEKTQWGEVRAENKCRNHHICFLNYSRGFESWYSHVDVICLIVLEAFGLSALVLLNLILLTLANCSHKLKELVKNHKPMAWFFQLKNPYTNNHLSVFYHEKIGSKKDLEN